VTRSAPAAAFGAAVVVALLVGHLLRDSPGYVVRGADGSYEGDIVHYVYWTRLVTLGGVQSAYSGTWPETYAVYPPIPLYAYQAIGNLYRTFEDGSFDAQRAQQSVWLHEAIKLVALAWHVLAGLALFLLARGAIAKYAAALYVVDPAALYDVAHWGQPDGAHSLFSVLAVGLLGLGAVRAGWASMALAVLAKPQAVAIAPLVALATLLRPTTRRDDSSEKGMTLSRGGLASVLGGLVVATAVAVVVCLPFIVSGHLTELLTLPGVISSVMPVTSADAHNLWWLVLSQRGLDPLFTPDVTRFVGPLTYRLAATGLVVLFWLFTYWLLWSGRARLAEAAALSVLGWFVFTTQAHENHLFFALPLLAMAWPQRPVLVWVFGLLSLTVLANMLLHDQLVLEALGRELDDPLVGILRLGNAALNVIILAIWSAVTALRGISHVWLLPRARVPI
jgi:hypothetical protein